MEGVSTLLKVLADGTPVAMAGVFLVLFLGAVKVILDQHKTFVQLLKDNIESQKRTAEINEKMLRLLGVGGG